MTDKECKPCPTGLRRITECPIDTICEPCSAGFYQDVPNFYTRCKQCLTSCQKQESVIVSECNRTHNTVCACKQGYFLRSPRELACEKHDPCAPGYGVSTLGTSNSNTVCEECPVGTFSSLDSPTEFCRPHTDCTYWGGVKTPGTSSTDNICHVSPHSGVRLPTWATALLGSFGALAILLLIGILVYCILKKRGRWNSCRDKFTQFCQSKARDRAADLGNNNLGHDLRRASQTVSFNPNIPAVSMGNLNASANNSSTQSIKKINSKDFRHLPEHPSEKIAFLTANTGEPSAPDIETSSLYSDSIEVNHSNRFITSAQSH